ncbi:hypothetical protein PIB30_050527 [Stylosanthes scabra]|uniref:Uncharacterized protein n=1 Tax=Stylosanthes scabra TaxID=79078 RepID=A0ABU6UGJ2_9FABA|nr:hypothetical protein [Stylosanthes scabra]
MESDKAEATSRRSERSSSTQGVYLSTLGEERDWIAPKCSCRVVDCLIASSSCGLIYTSKLGNDVAGKGVEPGAVVVEHFARMEFECRVSELEKRVGCLEQRKKLVFWPYVIGLVGVVVAMCAVTIAK